MQHHFEDEPAAKPLALAPMVKPKVEEEDEELKPAAKHGGGQAGRLYNKIR